MAVWRFSGKLFSGVLFCTQSLWGYGPAVARAIPAFVLQNGHSDYVSSVAFSPDGRILASGSWDDTVKLWELGTGKLVRTLEGRSGNVFSVAFSPDGQTLASGSADTSFRWWRLPDGDLLAISYAFAEDYLTFTPEGLYVAADDGERLAAWRVGGELYGFERYAERFHRSDLVARRLAGGAIEISRGVTLAIDRSPRLWIEPFRTTNRDRVKLLITYEGDSELDHLLLVFNGEPLPVETPRGKRVVIEVPLRLVVQHNRLVVLATDIRGLRARPLTVEFEYLQGAKSPGSPYRPE